MIPLKVIVVCEHSGVVRDAFRAAGHRATSLDILPDASRTGGHHIQWDALDYLSNSAHIYDLMICHPPCTYLTGAAEWALKDGPYHQQVRAGTLTGDARRVAREKASQFFLALLGMPIPHIAVENPVGCMSRITKPTQIIQPFEFGSDASKKTCLWLKGLPELVPTEYIEPRMENGKPRWGNQTPSGCNKLGPGPDRWAARSLTFPGIADAMATQWGDYQ